MGWLRWPKWAPRRLADKAATRTTRAKRPRRTARPVVEKLEDRLALAPIITPHYEIPNFGDYATIHSDSSGAWSNPDTWSAGRVPTAGDVVVISTGTSVTYDLAASAALDSVVIYAGGLLSFRTDISTQMLVTNLQVLEGGELRVGTAANPVAAEVTAQIVFRNVALNTTRDPSQFGNGLIGLGKVTMLGASKVSAVRLAAEPRTGDTTIRLSQPASGWRVGDKLVIPDSKQWLRAGGSYVSSLETATIDAISADGKTLTLTAPLQFDHPGARNGDDVLEYLPHVVNRSRNVVIRSESATGTRGHVLFTHRADIDVRYAAIAGTGRTRLGATSASNPTDRFPVTFAHLYGPTGGQVNGFQFTFVGNAVFCPLTDHQVKWGIGIRDSHFGLIQENVLYNWAGASLATVQGNESFNVIEGNVALGGRGVGAREGEHDGGLFPGDESAGFWFRGPNNFVRENISTSNYNPTGFAAYGFKYYQSNLGTIRVPNFAGADTSVAGQYTEFNGNALVILEFARNEMYGLEDGLTIWEVNTNNTHPNSGGESVIKDTLVWHVSHYGYFGYPTADVTFDGWIQRGYKPYLQYEHESSVGMWAGDYMTKNMVVRNADIQGLRAGIGDPTFGGYTTLIEDSYLRNVQNIWVSTLRAPGSGGSGANRLPKSMIIRDVVFGSIAGWTVGYFPSAPPANIALQYVSDPNELPNLIQSDTVFVENYNGTGVNYQVYYSEQRANFVVPQSVGQMVGSPIAGLTNEQNWNQFGIAIAGAVAPADAATVAGILGLAKAYVVPPDTTPPSPPTNLVGTAVSASQIHLTWTASTDNVRVAGYRIYRDGVHIGSTSAQAYAATGLAAGTTYTFTAIAYDDRGNVSAASAPANATTLSPSGDSTPPTAPTGLSASAVSATRVNLAWTASTDNVHVAGYRMFRNGVLVGTSSTTTFAATGLAALTTYTFTVRAYDAAGNVSATSAAASATTLAPPPSNIIDDGDVGSRLTKGWWRNGSRGYDGDVRVTGKGAGGKFTTWMFTGLANGQYNVWVTYTANGKNATDAPYWIYNGSGAAPLVKVNQRLAPTQLAEGAKWRFLRKVNVVSGWAMVKLTNNANGIVVADAVRLVKLPSAAPAAASLPIAGRVVEAKPPKLSIRDFLASTSTVSVPSSPPNAVAFTEPVALSPLGAEQLDAQDLVLSQMNDVNLVSDVLEETLALLGQTDDSLASDEPGNHFDENFVAQLEMR